MRKVLMCVAMLLFVAGAALSAESDDDSTSIMLGIGGTPMQSLMGNLDEYSMTYRANFNAGIFWTGIDWIFVDNSFVSIMTSTYDAYGTTTRGSSLYDGYVMTFDIGLRLPIGIFIPYIGIGVNTLYTHDQFYDAGLGVNIKTGFEIKLGCVGFAFSLTSVQGSFEDIGNLFHNAFSSSATLRDSASKQFSETVIPSFLFVLYL